MSPHPLNNVKFIQKCIIVNSEGKILALKRSPSDYARSECWDLPGGQYEEGETVDEHIAREVLEETGLNIRTHRPVYLANSIGSTSFTGLLVFAISQVCSDWTGEVNISTEHSEYRWVTPDQFLDLDTGDDGGFFKNSVRAYLEGQLTPLSPI